jgi:5-methylcytosine-specific restriction endonuclease McrA
MGDLPLSKTCSKCGLTKLPSEFYKHSEGANGLRPDCKQCVRSRSEARYGAKHESINAQRRREHADNPGPKRAADQAYYLANKDTCVARVAKWGSKNPHRKRAYKNKWKQENLDAVRMHTAQRRAARKRAPGVFTKQDYLDALEASCGLCAYCLQPGLKLTIEHVTPIAHGGAHDSNNIVMACESCNYSKGARGPLCMVNR